MTTQLRRSSLTALVLALALSPAFAAVDTKKSEKKSGSPATTAAMPASARKKPELHIDPTPLDPKNGVVMSYADVVAPAQKTVVSIYSTKIVRERFSNPL